MGISFDIVTFDTGKTAVTLKAEVKKILSHAGIPTSETKHLSSPGKDTLIFRAKVHYGEKQRQPRAPS